MKKLFAVSALVLACASANANQFVLTNGDVSKSGKQNFALDFVSNGDGTVLVVKVGIPDTEKATVDLSNCGKGVPKGFTGQCNVARGELIVLVTSEVDALLPKGQISLGVFSVSYSDGKARSFAITSTEVASPKGEQLSVTSTAK